MALTACTTSQQPDGSQIPTGSTGTAPSTGVAVTSGTGLIPPDTGASGATLPDGDPGTALPSAPAGPPAAATLRWLDGAQASVGIITDEGSGQRWTGRRAGEHATLGDGWYRYFGADGSLVGCTSAGACVGVGADDTVAIVGAPGAARQVYTSDGTYLGQYSPDGDKLAPEASPADLREALAHSGVDLAGLVEAATRDAPFAGGVMGDPHVITRGGQRYTTQTVGQFEARTGDSGVEIQLQFSPMAHRGAVSLVSALALGTGADTVLYDMQGALTINGEMRLRVTDFAQIQLGDGVVVGQWPAGSDGVATVVVTWPDGGSVVATADRALGITVIAHLYPSGKASGIFGAESIGSGPDLVTRSGNSIATAGSATAAVTSWRVLGGRLLPTPVDQAGTDAEEPATVDEGALKIAQKLCSDYGLQRSQDIAACAFDVGLTGDTAFLPKHLAVATASIAPAVPAGFARRWPALQVSGLVGATDLPTDGALDIALVPGGTQVYQVTLAEPGRLSLWSETPCAAAGSTSADATVPVSTPSGMDQPSWRLFGTDGQPMSGRLPLCGTQQVEHLDAGAYLLALGNGIDQAGGSSDPLEVHAVVRVP